MIKENTRNPWQPSLLGWCKSGCWDANRHFPVSTLEQWSRQVPFWPLSSNLCTLYSFPPGKALWTFFFSSLCQESKTCLIQEKWVCNAKHSQRPLSYKLKKICHRCHNSWQTSVLWWMILIFTKIVEVQICLVLSCKVIVLGFLCATYQHPKTS